MKFTVKQFDELTANELYAILKARINVFVVEQNCPYPDLDGIDKHSLHIFALDRDGECSAYMRAFLLEPGLVQIGRVLTVTRRTGIGGELLSFGVRTIIQRLHAKKIYVEAQTYATGFYEREGFVVTSDEYMEDGISHVRMELEVQEQHRKEIEFSGLVEVPMSMTGEEFSRKLQQMADYNNWILEGSTRELIDGEYVDGGEE